MASAARELLNPVLNEQFPFTTLFFAVLWAAWVGGRGPALFAVGLGIIACVLFLLPARAFTSHGRDQQVGLSLYVAVGTGTALLGGAMRESKVRAAEQTELWRATLRCVGDAVVGHDAEGRVSFLNPVAEARTGWTAAEASGVPLDLVFRIVNEGTRAPVENPAARALREGAVVGLANHTVLIARDGTERPIDDSAAPVRDETGTVSGAVLVFRDISERKKAETLLGRSESRFHRLFEQSPLSIQLLAPDGRTLRVNRAWEQLWGGTLEEHLWDYNLLRDPQLVELGVAPLIERAFAGEAVELPAVGYAPDRGAFAGRKRWVRASLFPVRDAAGGVEEVVLVHEDITPRREAEDAQQFLAEAGTALASSLDYEETLAAVSRLVTPRLADWCSVTVTDPAGRLRQLAVAHAYPRKVEWARALADRYPPDRDAPLGVPNVIRNGEAEVVAEVTDAMLVAGARDPEHLAILRELDIRSYMVVPLSARGRTLGAITYVSTAESGRRFNDGDLALALDLGRRAGLAVDNARLFREAQSANALLGLLVEAAARLTAALDVDAVRAAVLDLSERLVAADAHAVWRLAPGESEWSIVQSHGSPKSTSAGKAVSRRTAR